MFFKPKYAFNQSIYAFNLAKNEKLQPFLNLINELN